MWWWGVQSGQAKQATNVDNQLELYDIQNTLRYFVFKEEAAHFANKFDIVYYFF